MENKPRHIELDSRIYKEDFKTSWRINGFNLMPFQNDHPVYGPWFMLGKSVESQWSVLLTKEIHGGVKNVGFMLIRAQDDTTWDMVTFSLGLKLEDGRFVKCIEKQVISRESNNSYVYLVKTIESQLKEHMKVKGSDCRTTFGDLSNQLRLCEVRKPCGMPDIRDGEDGPFLNGSCGMRVSIDIENNRGLHESSAFKGSTNIEDESSGEEPSGVKEPTVTEIERRDSEIISKIIARDAGNRSMSDVPTTSKGLTDGKSAETSKQIVKDVKNVPTPEELFQQETVTVVCEIEYTYMMIDPVSEKEETEHDDLVANFGDLFESGKFSDVILKCENANLSCHKAVLYTRSKLFKQFLDKTASTSGTSVSGTAQQLLIVNVNFDLSILKAILFYMYTNELDDEFGTSADNCWNLYKAAGLFGISGLRSLCLEVLDEIDDCHVDDSKDLCEKLSVLSIYTSGQKGSVDVLAPLTSMSKETSISN